MNRASGVAAIIALTLSACATQDSTALLCETAIEPAINAILGDSELEIFSVERLEECEWTSEESPEESILVQLEDVPDGELFIQHAIEATDPALVQPLEEGSVMFTNEAVIGSHGNRVALVSATVDTELLVPVLEAALDGLASAE